MTLRLTRRAALSGVAGGTAALLSGLHVRVAASQTADPTAPYGLANPADPPFAKASIEVAGSQMAYIDEGQGSPVLFLHGNPTSSYLWRNVIPHVTEGHRAIAPDLIGMGDSAKPDIAYSFADHYTYLSAFVEALDLTDLTLVVHDWGSALGMKLAREMPDRVRAMAYMEAIVAPGMPAPNFEALGEPGSSMFRAIKTPGQGEEMILRENFFIEEVLAKFGVLRGLGDAEMVHYRAPFVTEESRKPILAWPRQIPVAGEPADVVREIEANSDWVTSSDIPKLLFWAEPGAFMPRQAVDWHIANVPNLETRFLGAGLHFLQEDHPDQIGLGIADWLRRT